MSEVKRYMENCGEGGGVFEHRNGDLVLLKDFDRVTAELASAVADKEAYAQNAIDLRKRVDALQHRLTAADERADVLEGLLREAWEYDISTPLKRKITRSLKPAQTLSDFPQRQEPGSGPGPRYGFHAGVPMSSASTEYSPQTLKAGGFVDNTPAEGGSDEA